MVNGKKLLAMLLVFTLTFSYFSVVTEALATTSFVSLFGSKSGTGSENVEFDAVFKNGDDEASEMVSDVNNESLAIKMQLDVKDSGYLKNAKVEIKGDNDSDLNFKIKDDNNIAESSSNIQSLEDNVLQFNKIDNSAEKIEVSIPIEYQNEKYINEDKLNSKALIVLSGTYIDDNGKEKEISKEIPLILAWKDERTVKVESEITKYIQFGDDGIVLQTMIQVDSSNPDKNSLPAKETELKIDVPTIDNNSPKEIRVVANSTAGTNGKGVGETDFTDDNWTYNEEENKITIKVENQKESVKVEDEESYLKVEGEEKEEERYFSGTGVDEYLVTYTYRNIQKADEYSISTRAEAKLTTLSGVKSENNINEITAEKAGDFVLKGQTGNLVSYNIENETKDVSKVYAYLNKEKEYNSKTAINISYKDIVEEINVEDTENYYIDKEGNKISADDMYYKEISVNKDEFNNILGEDGSIQILDESGNVLSIINKDLNADDNGNYVIGFQDRISKITIKTSQPVNEGNLVISNKKATTGTSLAKADYANVEYIATSTKQTARFSYVSDIVELGNCTIKTKLNDTVTDINLVVDRDSLSTVTTNSNVEMRLELNNDEETSDTFGNSVFEVEMPEYITGLNVTNASMIYGEGLDISNVETYVNDNGRAVVKVAVSGEQTELNSGVLTNGANIVLNADVDVDKYTPSKETEITAYCYNSEATNYANATEHAIDSTTICDSDETKIEYSAPSGVVAINTTANYNELGTELTSIKQGEQVDYIDIYSEAKKATMEVVVINNEESAVSNLSILGRIPFKGVKDIATGDDLGTTLDTTLVDGIISNESNNAEFKVYYSEKAEATKDLTDSSNAWTENPSNFENVKSYLIVPADENYKMEPEKVLKFSYEYMVPENLDHNENIYGTFMAYYTINTDSTGTNDETAKPDLIGLSTGVGPELDMTLKTSKEEVKELDEFTVTATIKNTGADVARDVSVNIPIPTNTTYVSAKGSRDTINTSYENGTVVASTTQLAKDDSFDVEITLKVNSSSDALEQTPVKAGEKETVSVNVSASATDLEKELVKNVDLEIIKSELQLTQRYTDEYPDSTVSKGMEVEISLYATNSSDKELKNVKVVTKLPSEIQYSDAYMVEQSSSGESTHVQNAVYDSSSNTVTWTIDKLAADDGRNLHLFGVVGDLSSGMTESQIKISSEISADGTDTYNAEDVNINLGKSSLSVTQTSSTSTYVKAGNAINYTFSIKNEGSTSAKDVVLTDIVPDGLVVTNLSYSVNGEENEVTMSESENAELNVTVPANSQVDVNVQAVASELDGVQEKTVTNEGTITTGDSEEIKSNSVTHIVQASESTVASSATDNGTTETGNSGDITKTYKITGTAWVDSNENGMRDNDETRMSNVTAMLVDSSSGTIKTTVTTNNSGEYSFTGIQNGSYLVLFKYDTTKYTTTTYRKEGVETSINSDVVTTKIEQDGKKENGAVTDVIEINGANVSNVDIGLVESAQFSLSLDKSISKVTVQNSQGTKTEEFDNTKLAKYDIAAKYLSGTTVYVEYTIKVTNNGDLSGYASEIVDYIPEGMTFNSNLNTDWYTGTDGSLYTKALANSEIAKGESKEVKLVLTKQMTAENTGLVSNTAEIADDFNIYGVSDNNSTPANKAQGEDDISTADTILTVKTGEGLIYTSAIIISLIIGGAVAFVVYERVLKNKRKGGV